VTTFKDLVHLIIDGSGEYPTFTAHFFPELQSQPAHQRTAPEKLAASLNLRIYPCDALMELFEDGHDIRVLLEENLRMLGLVLHYVEHAPLCGPIDEAVRNSFQSSTNTFYQLARGRGGIQSRLLKLEDQREIVENLQQAVEVHTNLLIQHVEFVDPLERGYHPRPYGRFILVPDQRGSTPFQVEDIVDPEKDPTYSEFQDAPSFRSWNRHDLARWVKRERTNVLYGNNISPLLPIQPLAERARGFYFENYLGSKVRAP
jgi:hypothetical protein